MNQSTCVTSNSGWNTDPLVPLIEPTREEEKLALKCLSACSNGTVRLTDMKNLDRLLSRQLRLDATINMNASNNNQVLAFRWRRLDRSLSTVEEQEESDLHTMVYEKSRLGEDLGEDKSLDKPPTTESSLTDAVCAEDDGLVVNAPSQNGDAASVDASDEDLDAGDSNRKKKLKSNELHRDRPVSNGKKARSRTSFKPIKRSRESLLNYRPSDDPLDTDDASPGFFRSLVDSAKHGVSNILSALIVPLTDAEDEVSKLTEAQLENVLNSDIDNSLRAAGCSKKLCPYARNMIKMAFRLNGDDHSPTPSSLQFAVVRDKDDQHAVRVYVRGYTEIRLRSWVNWICSSELLLQNVCDAWDCALETRKGVLGFSIGCHYLYVLEK